MASYLSRVSAVAGLALVVCGSPIVAVGEEYSSLANAFRQGWVQVGLVSGRIVLNGSRGVNYSTTSGPADRQEQLSIRMSGIDPVVSYQLTTPGEEISIDFTSADRLQIRRVPQGKGRAADGSPIVPVEFRQSPHEPVLLKIGAKENEKVFRGASLWHLMVLEPAACRQHLLPLLRTLQGDWDLAKTSGEIEEILLTNAGRNLPDEQLWAKWIQELGDERFAIREAADERLRATGRVVVTYLQQLDPHRLDAEQQYRIRRIIAVLSDNGGDDSPDSVAAWLSGDPTIWLAMLPRDDENTRRASARRLEALLGRAIRFDPTADAATRAHQIEEVRSLLTAK